jgi:hypothetical protein
MREDSFDFIDNSSLRKNIIDSIDYVSALYLQSESIDKKHHQELYRTIIFYNASIVEALLLFVCTKKAIDILQEKYTNAYKLPEEFQNKNREICITLKKKIKKNPAEISFSDLINSTEIILGKLLTKKILLLKDLRNTIHLSKNRTPIKQSSVLTSSDIVLNLIKKIQKEI